MLGNQSNKIYLSISNGRVVRKVAEGTPGAEPFTKADGTIIWQMRFGFVTGILKAINIKTGSYNGADTKDWVFELEDKGEAYSLQIPYDSRNATSLIKALCNPVVDFSKPLTITPWLKVIDGKKKMACYLKQGETPIDWYFTKDSTHGMPELVPVKIKGKETWDNYDQMQFLEGYINTNVKSKLSANTIEQEPEEIDLTDVPEPDDDLPF